MPEYKDVNKSDMLKYLNMIEEMVLECKHHFSFAALFAIIIAAYEYCLCYSYFYLNTNVTALNGQKVTQGHIYGFLSSKNHVMIIMTLANYLCVLGTVLLI